MLRIPVKSPSKLCLQPVIYSLLNCATSMYRSIVEMIFDTSAKDDIYRSFVRGSLFFFCLKFFCRCVSFREQDARESRPLFSRHSFCTHYPPHHFYN